MKKNSYNRLNAKMVNVAFKNHVLEIAKSSAEDYELKVETLAEAKNFIVNTFINQMDFEIKQARKGKSGNSIQDIFINWLQGLSLDVLFTTNDINMFLNDLNLKYNNEGKEAEASAYIYYYKIFKVVSDELMEAIFK